MTKIKQSAQTEGGTSRGFIYAVMVTTRFLAPLSSSHGLWLSTVMSVPKRHFEMGKKKPLKEKLPKKGKKNVDKGKVFSIKSLNNFRQIAKFFVPGFSCLSNEGDYNAYLIQL